MIIVNDRRYFLKALKDKLPPLSIGVEVGVLKGEFSEKIFKIINPETLFLIDPFKVGESTYNKGCGQLPTAYSTDEDYEMVCLLFEDQIHIADVQILRMLSCQAVGLIENKTIDFVYLDASHLYEDVKENLIEWLPKLQPGGLMCGHDYIQHESFGVIQAVDEFCKEHNFEMIIFNENGGDYALKRII